MRVRLGSTFESLRVRNYRLFATGQLISQIFSWVQITAQDWLVLQLSHNSPTALGFVTALQFTPVLVLTLYAGKLADRYDKRALLQITNFSRVVLAGLMGVLVVSGRVQLWHVLAFAALWGAVTAVDNPIRQSFVSEMVGRPLLPNALALSSATFNSARVIGPAIGGLMIATLDTGAAFVVNAIFYVGPLVALAKMRPSEFFRDGLPGTRMSSRDTRISDGIRYVRRRPDLLLPLGFMLVTGMLGFNFQLTLAVLSKNVFHASAASFGLLSASLGAGALLGALAGSNRRGRPSVWVVIGAEIAFGVLDTAAGLMPGYLLTALVLFPTGFTMIYLAQAANQRVQMGVEAEVRGRVMALYVLVFMGTNPVGGPLVGWLADAFGPRASILLGGVASVLVGGVALVVRLRIGGSRLRMRWTPMPKLYVDVAPAWQGEEHGVPSTARLSLRRFHPVTAARRPRSERTGADLSRVDS